MKAIITAMLMILGALAAAAQNGVACGIEAAPQLSPGISYRAGANLSIPLRGKLSIDPGLFLTMHSRTSTGESTKNGVTKKHERAVHGQFLQMPLRLGINNWTRNGNLFQILVGPYFAYGIGGSTKITETNNGEKSIRSVSSFAESYSSRFDWGIDAEFKYYIQGHYQIGAYLQTGCKRIYVPDNAAEAIFSEIFIVGRINLALGLSIGYRF
ncbi:MAG: PorT family protein [Clostridium sp.]|nr:PorT family protein [Clostridium sp.]